MAALAFARRTVIITGAGGAIGKPLSLAFAKAGANVVVNDYGCEKNGRGSSSTVATRVTREITDQGFSAVADHHSVTEADKIVETAIAQFGRVDVIINNAGISLLDSVEAMAPADIRSVFEVNALGAIALCHYAWPHMQKQKYGRIVNFSSDTVFGMLGHAAYVMSRGAILGVTRTLAAEGAAHNILVNSIGPTAISRLSEDSLKDLPENQARLVAEAYTGESNVPQILALASEENTHTGHIWTSGNYAMGRTILGTVKEVQPLKTASECLAAMEGLLDKRSEWTEPHSVAEFNAFRSFG